MRPAPAPNERGPDAAADPGALLRRVARGEEAAFAALYDAVAGQVYGVALRVVRDPQHAEDVAQEALVEVWRSAARFDPARGTALAWILTIAHRRAVDRVRSVTAARARDTADAAGDVRRDHDVVTETAEAHFDAARVRRCLDGLTDLQRESITLAYYGGRTYPQVAALLEVSLSTVKTRMRDGLIRLRDCLGDPS